MRGCCCALDNALYPNPPLSSLLRQDYFTALSGYQWDGNSRMERDGMEIGRETIMKYLPTRDFPSCTTKFCVSHLLPFHRICALLVLLASHPTPFHACRAVPIPLPRSPIVDLFPFGLWISGFPFNIPIQVSRFLFLFPFPRCLHHFIAHNGASFATHTSKFNTLFFPSFHTLSRQFINHLHWRHAYWLAPQKKNKQRDAYRQ